VVPLTAFVSSYGRGCATRYGYVNRKTKNETSSANDGRKTKTKIMDPRLRFLRSLSRGPALRPKRTALREGNYEYSITELA
jgi:hypothetical protein